MLVRAAPLPDEQGNIVRWYGASTDIEDRKRAEEKVSRQQRELRQILDLVPHHIAVAVPDGTLVYGNHVFLDYYGLTTEDLQDSETAELARVSRIRTTSSPSWRRGNADLPAPPPGRPKCASGDGTASTAGSSFVAPRFAMMADARSAGTSRGPTSTIGRRPRRGYGRTNGSFAISWIPFRSTSSSSTRTAGGSTGTEPRSTISAAP